MVPKCSYPSAIGISQELQIEEGSSTAGPASKNTFPASLLFVAVSEHNMCMRKRRIVILGKFFESENVSRRRSTTPRIEFYDVATNTSVSTIKTRLYAPNSASSKILWSLRSTDTLKPALRRAAVVVGVNALRCSAGLVSARRWMWTARMSNTRIETYV